MLVHGEHLIKGSYAVEMQLYLQQSQKYGLLCADFRENFYKLSVGRWVDLLCPISPTLTTNVDDTDRNAFPPLRRDFHVTQNY